MLTMMKPDDVTHQVVNGAYELGKITAEVLHVCCPDMGEAALDKARDRMIAHLCLPYSRNPHLSSLLPGIQTSAWSGFQDRWLDLEAEGLSPEDAEILSRVGDEVTAALQGKPKSFNTGIFDNS